MCYAADMWAVGIICYILVCGRPPYDGKNQEEIIRKIQNKNYRIKYPSKKSRGDVIYSKAFRDFIARLLTHDVDARLSADDALKHEWIAGDAASTSDLHSSSYIQSLKVMS